MSSASHSQEMPKKAGRIVIIDDDPEMRSLLEDFLTSEGHEVQAFPGAVEALGALGPTGSLAKGKAKGDTDLILSDIKMPRMDGLEFTSRVRELRPEIPVMLATAFGSIDTAIEAMRRGAWHYIVKPFKLAEVSVQVQRAIEHRRLSRDNATLRSEIKKGWSLQNEVIGRSAAMSQVFDLARRVSGALANVLITGESGSGKEVIARAIHNLGPRAEHPFIAINCTAIPETLLESELFGHAKGAFTGAQARKKGLFEEAEGGTLFLDEIGDMPVSLQAKLLRVLQERRIRAVGDTQSQEINVRIVAATHKDLRTLIKEGLFREDLYFRLAVIPIHIPALRERREDIPLLAEHFLRKAAATNHMDVQCFTPAALDSLVQHRWEGNVRELENIVERAVVLSTSSQLDLKDLPFTPTEEHPPERFFESATQDFPTLHELERRYVNLILQRTGGRKEKAAQILGINRRTLLRWEKESGTELGEHPEETAHEPISE